MTKPMTWRPPRESARRRHSIFVDVELWDDHEGRRIWSCPMLAAVWQLARLGLLRDHGRPVLVPQDWTGSWPDNWAALPAITRLDPSAPAFAAYTTLSALSPRFLPVELAVRTILSQFAGDPTVLAETRARAAGDGMRVPPELVDRIRYVFVFPGQTDPGLSRAQARPRPGPGLSLVPSPLSDLSLRVGRQPQFLELPLEVIDPVLLRSEHCPDEGWPDVE